MMIDLLSGGLSIGACGAAAAACFILNRRLRRLESTDSGIGRAVAEMSQSVTRLQQALTAAEAAAKDASARLDRRMAEAKALSESLGAGRAGPEGRATTHPDDPLADIVPKGLGEKRSSGGPRSSGSPSSGGSTGREALARFAIAARAADRQDSRRSSEAAA